MQLGLSSFAFGWAIATHGSASFTADTLLDFAVAHEVPVIQFGDNLPLHSFAPAALDGLARQAKERNIAVETGARGLTEEHLHRYIGISQRLDARLMRFVVDTSDYEPSVDSIVAIVRNALPALHTARLTLGIENHDRLPCATLRRLMDTIDDANVGICLDTANSLGAGEGLREVLHHLAPVCVNLHLKDFAIERLPYLMGFTVSGRSLGTGQLPLDETLRSVVKHGRCATAVIELWVPPESDPEATITKEAAWAAQSIETLRSALAGLAV